MDRKKRVIGIQLSGTRAFALACTVLASTADVYANQSRVGDGLIAAYEFTQGSGSSVLDTSGLAPNLDLTIDDISNVSWSQCDSLEVQAPVLISHPGAATKLNNRIANTNELTIEAWIKPNSLDQTGPARIATLSNGAYERNFTLGQDNDSIQVRLRTTDAGLNGTNTYLETNQAAEIFTDRANHVVYTRDANEGHAKIYVNGQLVTNAPITGDFTNWDDQMGFALANEFGYGRPWIGEYFYVGLYDRALLEQEVQQNFGVKVAENCGQQSVELFQVDTSIGEANLNVNFDASNVSSSLASVVSYAWDFGDGTSATGAVQSHTYVNSGNYLPTLTVSFDNGETLQQQRYVRVLETGTFDRSAIEPELLYVFRENTGAVVHNVGSTSGSAESLDLIIQDPDHTAWKECGGLSIGQETQISSSVPPSDFIQAVKSSNASTIEAWIIPENDSQNGPARIFTLSNGQLHRNFTLGQENDEYLTRYRTSSTNSGASNIVTQTVGSQVNPSLTHVVYTREDDGTAKIYVDGNLAGSQSVPSGTDTWSDHHLIGVGNEIGGGRPWLGEVYLLAAYSEALPEIEIAKNYNAGVISTCNIEPVARFDSSIDAGVIPLSTSFDASESKDYDGTIVRYQWNFGDGNTAEGQQVNHTFTQSGHFTVTLEVEDDQGAKHQVSKTIVSLPSGQVSLDRIAHYDFSSAQGNTIFDRSGFGSALDLSITDPNASEWLSCGGLSITGNSFIGAASSPTKLVSEIQSSNEMTLEAWINPANLTQTGSARIATLSNGTLERNFTLGQAANDLEFRLRTSGTNDNGIYPHVVTSSQPLENKLSHVVYTRDSAGNAKLFLDGAVVGSEQISGEINNWASDFSFGLGSEPNGERSWLGDIHQVSVYRRALIQQEVAHNFALGVVNTCSNRPPEITSAAVTNINQGEAYQYAVLATDPDGDPLVYSLNNAPAGLTIDSATGVIDWTQAQVIEGTYAITIVVTDSSGLSATQTYNLVVVNPNQPPVALDQQLALNEDSLVAITLTGNDPDQDALGYSLVLSPQNGTLSGVAPNLSYLPNANFNGQDSFTFMVNDGAFNSNIATISLTINAQNDAPVADSQSLQVLEDASLNITLFGSDVDGDAVQFSIDTNPLNGTLTGAAPNIIYTPNADYSGSDSFTYSVSDGLLTAPAETISIDVQAVNDEPVFTATTLASANEGVSYQTNIAVTDADGDALIFALANEPSGMVIGSDDGLLTWANPVYSGAPVFFDVLVTDASNVQVSQTFELDVTRQNNLPTIASNPHLVALVDQSYQYTVNASDSDGDSLAMTLRTSPNGMTLQGNRLDWVPATQDLGKHDVMVEISDGFGITEHAFELDVVDVSSDTPVYFGRDFWFLGNMFSSSFGQPRLMVLISSQVDTQGVITAPSETGFSDIPFTVQANELTEIDIWKGSRTLSHDSIQNSVRHLHADDDVTVYILHYAQQSTDATALLPEVLLGNEYKLSGYTSSSTGNGGYSLLATEDNTRITISPANDLRLSGGITVPKGGNYEVNLNKGQFYYVQSHVELTKELTGSNVLADKPIAVFINHSCTNVPSEDTFCDQLIEQLPPTSYWGTAHTLVPYYSRYGDLVRILAKEDQTLVSIGGAIVRELSAGEYWEYALDDAQALTASKPVLITQFSTGDSYDLATRSQDPNFELSKAVTNPIFSQVLSTDSQNYQSSYTVTIDPLVDHNGVVIVSLGENHEGLTVNGRAIDSALFSDKDYCNNSCVSRGGSRYALAQIALPAGTHTLSMPQPFGVYKNVHGIQQFGDPFVSVVPPNELALDHYIFNSPKNSYSRHFINLTIPSAAVGSLTLDGESVDTGFFQPIAGSNKLFARLAIEPGKHELRADQAFSLMVYGFDRHDSYGYIGGFGAPSLAPANSMSISVDGLEPGAGEQMCARIQVLDINQAPLNDQAVNVQVSGANTQVNTVYTGRDGVAEYCYTGVLEGTDTLSFEVGAFNEQFSISWQSASGSNKAPLISSVPVLYTEVGSPYAYDVQAQDPEQSSISYALVSSPIGMSIDANTGLITWTNAAAGTYDVTVSAQDPDGAEDLQNFRLVVNSLPQLVSLPEARFNNNRTDRAYSSAIEVIDPDGDPLRYTLIQGHEHFQLNLRNGNITTTRPFNTPPGVYELIVRVEDDLGGVLNQSFTIDLVDNNKPELLNDVWEFSAYPNEQLQFQLDARDIDDDDLRYSISSVFLNNVRVFSNRYADVGITFDDQTGLLTWDVPAGEAQALRINLNVFDVWNTADSGTLFLTTQDYAENALPSMPLTTAFEGQSYQYAIFGELNGLPTTVSLIQGPPNMTINFENGYYFLNWVPDAANCQHDVILEIDDGLNPPVQTQFTIDVYNAPKRLNRFQCSLDAAFCATR